MRYKSIKTVNCEIATMFILLLLIFSSSFVYGLTFDNNKILINTKSNEYAEWTIMVYLDGDNNLESSAIDDFLEMSDVGSTEEINIIVQFDRTPGYDYRYDNWVTTKRYYITQGMVPDDINAIQDIGEANMGDPQVLIDFATWAMSDYPAHHYCLIIWDHGNGWKTSNSTGRKHICEDDTNKDVLETYELRQALDVITSSGNNKLDLIGFDACLMGMIEIAYEIKNYALYMTGSEDTEPSTGWNYYNTLSALVYSSSNVIGEELGGLFVFYYSGDQITLSTLDLNLVEDLTTALDYLISDIQLAKYRDDIQYAMYNVNYYSDSVDLYHFIELLQQYIDDKDINYKAEHVLNKINDVVTSETHDSYNENSHGIAIYLPYYSYDQSYESLRFAQNSQWDEFLRWWFYGDTNNNPPKAPAISGVEKGTTGVEYSYMFLSTDPDGDSLYYYIEWGDSSDEEKIGPVESGETINVSHTWGIDGGYIIKAKAIDSYGVSSKWSYFEVVMPREKTAKKLVTPWFIDLFKTFISFSAFKTCS